MANRIDTGAQPTAHSAIQAMIVRAQQAADATGKPVGVHYDLSNDQLLLVDLGQGADMKLDFVRVARPGENGEAAETLSEDEVLSDELPPNSDEEPGSAAM